MLTGLAVVAMLLTSATADPHQPLTVAMSCEPTHLSLDDSLELTVTLENTGTTPVTLFGTLGWGHSAGLILSLTNESGERVHEKYLVEEMFHAGEIAEAARYVTLQPGHFLGSRRTEPARNFFPDAGRYDVRVAHLSPAAEDYATLAPRPLWGRSKGMIHSQDTCQVTVSDPVGAPMGNGAGAEDAVPGL